MLLLHAAHAAAEVPAEAARDPQEGRIHARAHCAHLREGEAASSAVPREALDFLEGLPGWVRSHTGCTIAGLEGLSLSLSLERLYCCGAGRAMSWLTLLLAAGLHIHVHVNPRSARNPRVQRCRRQFSSTCQRWGCQSPTVGVLVAPPPALAGGYRPAQEHLHAADIIRQSVPAKCLAALAGRQMTTGVACASLRKGEPATCLEEQVESCQGTAVLQGPEPCVS